MQQPHFFGTPPVNASLVEMEGKLVYADFDPKRLEERLSFGEEEMEEHRQKAGEPPTAGPGPSPAPPDSGNGDFGVGGKIAETLRGLLKPPTAGPGPAPAGSPYGVDLGNFADYFRTKTVYIPGGLLGPKRSASNDLHLPPGIDVLVDAGKKILTGEPLKAGGRVGIKAGLPGSGGPEPKREPGELRYVGEDTAKKRHGIYLGIRVEF